MRRLSSVYQRLLAIVAPAEGEEWLIGLAVLLLVLGAARHRLEPWLGGIGADPPPPVAEALAPIEPERFGRVDLNRATPAELETLPQIGPALAARIVADREARGPFLHLEDLVRVKGIGPATIAALAGEVVAEPP